MEMKNGVYAARKTDDGIKSVFIDEETLEMERLNRRSSDNCMQAAQTEAAEREAAMQEWKRQEAAARRKRLRAARLVKQEFFWLAVCAAVCLGRRFGLVEIAFAAPVLILSQSVICFRAGRYFGEQSQRRGADCRSSRQASQ